MAEPIHIPTLEIAWNTNFADQIGTHPAFGVEMTEFTDPGARNDVLALYSTAFAPDDTGEKVAVVLSGTPSEDFDGHIAAGEQAVVGCAPLDVTSWEQWDIGLAPPGQTLGRHESWTGFPAIALPLSAAGLRVWIGRLRTDRRVPIIDRTLTSALAATGDRVSHDSLPLPGIPRADLPRLCPGVVFVEPPRAGRQGRQA
jgi:hypothetical protein